MDTKGLQKEFISWCKSKNKSPKSEDETKQLFVAFMKEKHPEEYKQAVQNQQKQQQAQAKKAAHGTKLNYFKSLKNQCAEDEEVVYFKKGGSVKCGCKKKEEGGEIAKAQKGYAVDKFKVNRKLNKEQQRTKEQQAKIDKLSEEDYFNGTADHTRTDKPIKTQPQKKIRTKAEQDRINKVSEQDYLKGKGDHKIYKNCGGSAIKKFKMHRQGGSLNGIPFIKKAL